MDRINTKSIKAGRTKAESAKTERIKTKGTKTRRAKTERFEFDTFHHDFDGNIIKDVGEFLNTPVHYDPFKRNLVPFALRIRGSILGRMIPTLAIIGVWSSIVTYVHIYHYSLSVDSLLITVTGLVTSLVLGFRVNSAYERYSEGRRYWTQLSTVIRNTSRAIWWSIPEIPPPPEKKEYTDAERAYLVKEELLTKATAVRILVGFAYALKHHLRGQFGTDWDDLRDLIGFLPTYGRLRSELERKYTQHPQRRRTSSTLESLQTTFLRDIKPPSRQTSNKMVKATIAYGNLPLELLSFFGCYVDQLDKQGSLSSSMRSFFLDQNLQLQDILGGCERVLRTPLPLAFNISIAQITWVFILLLPFQLVGSFKWATIPACVAAAYMLLGLSILSFEIENPFGNDNNDLPLDRMCDVISTDIEVICAHRMSSIAIDSRRWMINEENRPLMPVYNMGIEQCLAAMTVEEIREALRLKVGRVREDGGTVVGEDRNEDPEKAGAHSNGVVPDGSINADLNGNGQARSEEIAQLPV
ncbi:Bestrophin, RFP-TM, chloride channel-domain-containing protein [Tirmania nivea]|nr:Bestrophin, RFP-TM, chloride channel-domain-containing protein [Tirmania nivea]